MRIDDRRDVRGRLDLQRVSLRRVGTTRLEATVTIYDDWDGRDLAAAGDGVGSLCLRMWTGSKRDPATQQPDYLACLTTAPQDERAVVGRLLRERANGLPRTVEALELGRPNERTVTLRFTTKGIGSPSTVRFAAESVGRSSSCSRSLGCIDAAPGKRGTASLALRKP